MIFKTASPISPDVTVAIDSMPVDYLSLHRISIEEHENQHTLMVLDFGGLPPENITDFIERPIRVTIDYPNLDGVDFFGYIMFLEPSSTTNFGLVNDSPFQMTRVYCMGASYLMKSKKSKSWENVTISDIATTIADEYKFSVSVPLDTYRFPRLVQAGQSDWEFLVETIQQLGYSMNVTGTHLHIWDPFKALSRSLSFAVLKTINGLAGDVSPSIGQVLRFEARFGAVTTTASRTPDTIHVLDSGGNIITVSSSLTDEVSGLGDSLKSQFTDTLVKNATSFEMAKRLVSGNLRKKFSVSATVDITGNPTIRSGGIIKLDKYDSKLDGFWYVKGAKHTVTKSELISVLDIVTDGTTNLNPTINSTNTFKNPPTPTLLRNHWVSETHYVNIYE